METYNLILNSKNTTNLISSSNLTSYTYYVNWSSVLPKPLVQKWKVAFTLKTEFNYNTSLVNTMGIMSINFGHSNTSEQSTSSSTFLGNFLPILNTYSSSVYYFYYSASTQDNLPVTISYPTNNNITVTFTDIDPSKSFTMFDYNVHLQFTPIY